MKSQLSLPLNVTVEVRSLKGKKAKIRPLRWAFIPYVQCLRKKRCYTNRPRVPTRLDKRKRLSTHTQSGCIPSVQALIPEVCSLSLCLCQLHCLLGLTSETPLRVFLRALTFQPFGFTGDQLWSHHCSFWPFAFPPWVIVSLKPSLPVFASLKPGRVSCELRRNLFIRKTKISHHDSCLTTHRIKQKYKH